MKVKNKITENFEKNHWNTQNCQEWLEKYNTEKQEIMKAEWFIYIRKKEKIWKLGRFR